MIQPYDPCPCGSGKKFKWCCQSFYADIQRAEEQFELGQIDAALRMIDDVIKTHPQSTEALGTKARILANAGKVDEADEVLEQALTINPTYPNGLLMRAQIRLAQGEGTGAALLARRAAEAYDPAAHGSLALLYRMLFDFEMIHQRPIAAHVAINLTARYAPQMEEARQILDGYFGPESPLRPDASRHVYRLRTPATNNTANDAARKARWEQAVQTIPPGRLGELATLCQEIASGDDRDAAAWFNLGLARAWLGDNPAAVEALDRSIQVETDFERAREAGLLGEVLRMGLTMTAQCDHLQHGFGCSFRDTRPISELLNEWAKEGRLLVQPSEQQGVFDALVLDLQKGIATADAAQANDVGTFAAYLHIEGPRLRMRGPNRDSIEKLRDTFRQRLSLPAHEAEISTSPRPFSDLILPALIFPSPQNKTMTVERAHEHARRYFEETWLHRPLKSLADNTPLDAVGSSVLKPKVAALVDFLQQCCEGPYVSVADFNRVRHKLGLDPVPEPAPVPQAVAAATAQVSAPATVNIPAMNAEQIAGLNVATLTFAQLDQAYQAALRLKAGELAKHFIETIVTRPAETDRNDRYHYYSYLILRELADGEPSKALDLATDGSMFDAEHNEGQRRDEFDLRQAQVLAKQGDNDKAGETLRGLFERSPEKAKLRIEAVETLLRLKKGKLALELAQAGLAVARERNDGDSAGAFEELSAAAKKTPG